MKTYKIYFTSNVSESIEVEASSEKEAEDKFDAGEFDLSDAKEEGRENLEVDLIEEIKEQVFEKQNSLESQLKVVAPDCNERKHMPKYKVVVRDECTYEKIIEAKDESAAWKKAIDNIDTYGFGDRWQPINKPQTTRLDVAEV